MNGSRPGCSTSGARAPGRHPHRPHRGKCRSGPRGCGEGDRLSPITAAPACGVMPNEARAAMIASMRLAGACKIKANSHPRGFAAHAETADASQAHDLWRHETMPSWISSPGRSWWSSRQQQIPRPCSCTSSRRVPTDQPDRTGMHAVGGIFTRLKWRARFLAGCCCFVTGERSFYRIESFRFASLGGGLKRRMAWQPHSG